jgi:hypothetical protein
MSKTYGVPEVPFMMTGSDFLLALLRPLLLPLKNPAESDLESGLGGWSSKQSREISDDGDEEEESLNKKCYNVSTSLSNQFDMLSF